MNSRTTLAALLMASGAATAAPNLGAPSDLASPQRPAGVASADFNGDGAMDLAVCTDNLDKISIYLGDGAGGFAAPTNVLTGAGTGPDAIVAADVDGDGDADLGVVLNGISAVRIYTNTGGVFTPGSQASTGAEPVSLITANLDGVGGPDFATANRDDDTITVFSNTGGVLSATSVAVGTEPRDLAAGDFDGDGDNDLAVTNHRDRSISILTNTGGSFATTATLFVNPALRPTGVDAGDVDADGDTDIVVSSSDVNLGINNASVYTNAAGVFSGPFDTPMGGSNAGEIMFVNLDADAAPEVVAANNDSGDISVLDNDGAGNLGGAMQIATGTSPDRLAAADFDASGSMDLAVTNRDSDTTSVILNQFVPCAADFNGDGVANGIDVGLFLQAYGTGDLAADMDGNGVLNGIDVGLFLQAFGAGC